MTPHFTVRYAMALLWKQAWRIMVQVRRFVPARSPPPLEEDFEKP